MPGTGSIRMAMRWSWSRTLLIAALVPALTGCMTSTAKYYVPTAGDTRLDENELRSEAEQLLRVECDRLKGGKTSVSGEGTFVLDVASTGSVQRVKVSKSTGDAALDDIFGALSARLDVEPLQPKAGSIRMRASYFCEPDKAITTIEMT
jgi:outer membrane biosynthesis protein TonB